jgi:outer membrane protein
MKNGLLVWNVVLTIIAGYLLFTQFKGNKKSGPTTPQTNDSLNSNKTFRIAYVEMDSVQSKYEMAKEATNDIKKKEDAINGELQGLERNYQNTVNDYQRKAQTMTPEESEKATQVVMGMQMQIKNRKETLVQDYNDLISRRNKEVRDKIVQFLNAYNSSGKYSYIFSYEPGLFYYSDTTYNITTDVIKGLNEEYKPATKKN